MAAARKSSARATGSQTRSGTAEKNSTARRKVPERRPERIHREEKRPPMEKILPAERVRLAAENHPERGIQRDSIKELPMRLIHIRINWHLRQGLRFLCYRSSVSFFICAFWVYVEKLGSFLQGFILDCLDGFPG